MSEHVYSGSVFWLTASVAVELARFSLPFALLLGCALWRWRAPSIASSVALGGALIAALGHLARWASPPVESISLGIEIQPLEDQNPFVFFFFMFGPDLGVFLVAAGLVAFFVRRRRA